jgi:hypothetical protein
MAVWIYSGSFKVTSVRFLSLKFYINEEFSILKKKLSIVLPPETLV